MISLYSSHGRRKRIAKFKSWWKAAEWLNNNWSSEKIKDKNYYLATTKT